MKSLEESMTGAGKRALGSLGGFRTFILRGNVVDLAVGIMIGAAFSTIVNSLVNDIILPLIPGNGKISLGDLAIPVWTGSSLKIGHFINAVISFLILAFVIYFF